MEPAQENPRDFVVEWIPIRITEIAHFCEVGANQMSHIRQLRVGALGLFAPDGGQPQRRRRRVDKLVGLKLAGWQMRESVSLLAPQVRSMTAWDSAAIVIPDFRPELGTPE